MKNNIYIITILAFAFILKSCTSPIDIIVDDAPPKMVIYAILDQVVEPKVIKLSTTAPFFGDKTPKVSNAKVSVKSSEGDEFIFEENSSDKGTYISTVPFGVVPGVKYDLKVIADYNNNGEDETFTATSTVEPEFEIDSILVTKNKLSGHVTYSAGLFAKNPDGKDFFLAKFLVNDSLVTDQITKYSTFNDEILSGSDAKGILIYMFVDEDERGEFTEKEQQDFIFIKEGDKMTMLLSKIEEGYSDFLEECRSEYNGENPIFGGPPANIKTNIKGGDVVGYFATHFVQSSTTFAK